MWGIYVDHNQLWAFALYELLSQSKVAIVPTNIRPGIIENIVQFSGLGLFQGEMSWTTGVAQGAIKSAMLCSWEQQSYSGATWESIEEES